MAQNRRTTADNRSKESAGIGSGPYLARVVSHLDPTFMGGLKVTLLRYQGNTVGDDTQSYIVRSAPPFFGSTPYEFMGKNPADFGDTQKSYGMWMIPPDIGVTVIVIFIEGDPSQGYWIGCVPPRYSNYMVPALGASTNVILSEEDKKKYNTKQPLPVGEVNRLLNAEDQFAQIDRLKKSVHPIADQFLKQGLLEDDVRGTTTSTARREVPSAVFGISTPGPLDKRNGSKRAKIGTAQSPTVGTVPVSRLGGTTFVMDDGDDRFQRKGNAGDVGQGGAYADLEAGEKGDPTIPKDEYVRIRTRTGHQLLMHNSEDLIYIGNSKGSTWIEMTSNGKIDIYAEDSVSVHTKTDFNLRADRDVNIEAGRNINMKATAQYSEGKDIDTKEFVSGRIQFESAYDTNVVVGRDGKITVGNNFDVNTVKANKFTAGTTTDILSGGNHTETAAQIHMNGPTAATAAAASPLATHQVIETDGTQEWASTRYVKQDTLESIMKRVPMHEPWALHENFAPELQNPDNTDRELTGEE